MSATSDCREEEGPASLRAEASESSSRSAEGDCQLTPEEQEDGELFLEEAAGLSGEFAPSEFPHTAGPPDGCYYPEAPPDGCYYPEAGYVPGEFAYLAGPPAEEITRWYRHLAYPKATQLVFQDPDLYGALCEFCRGMVNVVTGADGRVERVFCLSCCAVISGYEPNHCRGGTRDCVTTRYVDAVGAIAYLCVGCHQHEDRSRRGRHGRTPVAGKPRGRTPAAGKPRGRVSAAEKTRERVSAAEKARGRALAAAPQ